VTDEKEEEEEKEENFIKATLTVRIA